MHKRDDFAFPGLCIFPFTRGVEKLCSTPKVEKAGTSDLQQRGATFYIAALYFFEISYGWATTKCHQNPCITLLFHPGLGADLCKLCGCGYLGHVAPGSSPGTDKKKQKKKKKTNKTQKYDCKSESNVVSLAIPGMPKLFEQKSEKLK